MNIPFRQGIVRQQTDLSNVPTFLQLSPSGVTINVSPDPTLVTFAHGPNVNYLFEERKSVPNAWPGPFESNKHYWLYWDIDALTGERTFGYTNVEPVDRSIAPPSPAADTHWFNTNEGVMNVFTNGRWIEKIRCFAGKLNNGAVLYPYPTGSQVGMVANAQAGFLLFDDDDKAVKKFDRFGRGKFITTATPLSAQVSKLASFRVESEIVEGRAIEHIPAYSAISYRGPREIGLGDFRMPQHPAIGVAYEDMHMGEIRTYITHGFITHEHWDWDFPPGKKIFVGQHGQLTANVPQQHSIQQVATVVSRRTLLIDIQPLVHLWSS